MKAEKILEEIEEDLRKQRENAEQLLKEVSEKLNKTEV